jgi:hypothetical protein
VPLIDMLRELISQAEQQQFRLAPLIGIGSLGSLTAMGRSRVVAKTCLVTGRHRASTSRG